MLISCLLGSDTMEQQQRRWTFTMDAIEYGESWRWLHIDGNGVRRKSATSFFGYDLCAADARQHGWQGLTQPTANRRGNPPKHEGGSSVKARYVAKAKNMEPKRFFELELVRRYVHTLQGGTVVEISDLEAKPGQPAAYVLTAGEKGVVKVSPLPGKPSC